MTGEGWRPERGSFHARYAVPKSNRDKRNTTPRLMDCLLVIANVGDQNYFEPRAPGEFAIVDLETKEKGWFELVVGVTPEMVTAMIESNFAASAVRVDSWLWVV